MLMLSLLNLKSNICFPHSYSDLGENEEAPDAINPMKCYELMKSTNKPAIVNHSTKQNPISSSSSSGRNEHVNVKRGLLAVKSRSTTAIPYIPSLANKRASLASVKSNSVSVMKTDGLSPAAPGPERKTSPSLASLSTAVFSPASTSGATPGSVGSKDTDPLKNVSSAVAVKDLPAPVVRSASRQRFQATVRNSLRKVQLELHNETSYLFSFIEYGIIGEVSQILTNQKRENSAFSLLIGRNLRPFPNNFVLYTVTIQT